MKLPVVPLVLGAASSLCIAAAAVLFFRSAPPPDPIRFSSEATASAVMQVDVEGAVVRPGLYRLTAGARIEDAVAAAGGFSERVDTDAVARTINRAQKLVDGGKIFVPVMASSPVHSATPLVSINAGTQDELDELPGVGQVTAQKIIAARPYQTLEELVSKKTVGQSVFDKIKDQISL